MQSAYKFLNKYLVIIASLFLLVPFILISFFNNPTSDDYCLALDVYKFGYLGAQTHWYQNWGGRYASIAMVCLPILENSKFYFYKVFPLLLILFIIIAFYYLIKEVFRNSNFLTNIKIALVLSVVYIVSMPIISEGLYWWSGAMTYQLANILSLILVRLVLIVLRTNNSIATSISCILIFCIVGCNEISMLYVNLFLLTCLVISFNNNKILSWNLVILSGVSVICSAFVYFSPGHFIRQEMFLGNERFVYSILMSVAQFLFSVLSWVGISFVTAILIFYQLKAKINNSFFPISVFKSITIVSCFIILSFFVGFWATGQTLAPRAQNVIYLFFLLGFIYCFLNYFNNSTLSKQFLTNNPHLKLILICGYFSILFGQPSVKNVFTDLVKGKAQKYNQELLIRKQTTIQTVKNSDLVLKPIKNKPKTIFVDDLKVDKTYYYNSCYSQYWKLKSVRIFCEEKL